jgi:cyanophycin synthetase
MEEILPKEKPGACFACGSSPTTHATTFVFATLDGWFNDRLAAMPRLSWALNTLFRYASAFEPAAMRIMHYSTGGKTFRDITRTPTNRAMVLWREAQVRGIEMEQIAIFGIPSDCYRAKIGSRWLYFDGLPIPRREGVGSYTWLDDKYLFKRFLNQIGVSAAESFMTTSLPVARERFEQFGVPVVVKPRLGSRARHTTTLVQTVDEFERAFRSAQQLCRYVIFEEHLFGKLCRATVIEGALVGFIKKSAPEITGDGIHTIRELVAVKNGQKPERVWDIVLDEECRLHLKKQGHSFDSVIENGRTVILSSSTGRQVGGDTREMPDEIHPKLRGYIERVARNVDAPLLGFDIIIPDPEVDPDTQKWGILEANTLPFIDLHYNPLYGKTSNVAGAIWDLWQKKE